MFAAFQLIQRATCQNSQGVFGFQLESSSLCATTAWAIDRPKGFICPSDCRLSSHLGLELSFEACER